MRVMVMIKASKDSEAGAMPSKQPLAEMANFNEQLVKAGGCRRSERCTELDLNEVRTHVSRRCDVSTAAVPCT